jgi:hypothetical protein
MSNICKFLGLNKYKYIVIFTSMFFLYLCYIRCMITFFSNLLYKRNLFLAITESGKIRIRLNKVGTRIRRQSLRIWTLLQILLAYLKKKDPDQSETSLNPAVLLTHTILRDPILEKVVLQVKNICSHRSKE